MISRLVDAASSDRCQDNCPQATNEMELVFRIQAVAARALASGAIEPIETETEVIEDAGVQFVVRVVSSLRRKDAAEHRQVDDPLGDYEPELFVADASATHYVLLNKFPVMPQHLLIVVREYEPQDALLTLADFEALAECMAGSEALGFYNAGREAGASQHRKHLQVVPLPLAPRVPSAVPIEPLLDSAHGLPFRHGLGRIAQFDPAALHALYCRLLESAGASGAAAYNLLLTRRWMLVVPRRRERFESISVNALGFAGSLLARDRPELERIRAAGPMNVLRAIAM
jgi:ATP adenylyltransferase